MKHGLTQKQGKLRISTSTRNATLRLTPRLLQITPGTKRCKPREPRNHQVTKVRAKTGFGTPMKRMTSFESKLILLKCLWILARQWVYWSLGLKMTHSLTRWTVFWPTCTISELWWLRTTSHSTLSTCSTCQWSL